MLTATIAIPPGETIREMLDDKNMSQKEFAQRMGLSEKHVSRLINGHVELTPEVALKLSTVLGASVAFWSNLETAYRADIVRAADELRAEEEKQLISQFPYAKMAELGWVKSTRVAYEKIQELRAFFEVASLTIIASLYSPKAVYRRLSENEPLDFTLLAWEQRARVLARSVVTAKINLQMLESQVPRIRAMTLTSPESFYPELSALLASCGVALVLLPHIAGSYIHGATFFEGDRIILGLTVRGKDADRFWFSLFHELGHILQGDVGLPNNNADQRGADEFAADVLVPRESYAAYRKKQDYSVDAILEFARSISIHPGIVVGRLQNDKLIGHHLCNHLKAKYKLSS